MKNHAILTAAGLSFAYDEIDGAVLRNLSFSIPVGSTAVILGPNGSGKTTLLRLLLGVLRPAAGEVLLAGRPQRAYSRQERSRMVGLVPQGEHIPFDFSVLEYVLMGRAPFLSPLAMPGRADRRLALKALSCAGLGRLRDRPVPTLSGGERQLATVARALVQQPRVLLLDEPTAHLDMSNEGRLLEVIRDLSSQGVTLVLTSHDPNLASSIASLAILMREGKIMACGIPDAVLTAENLTATYGVPIEVLDARGRQIILLADQRRTGRWPTPCR